MQKQILKSKAVGTKLTPRECTEIEKMVRKGIYLGVSDFIREAVRDKLETLKIVNVKDVSFKQTKKEVLSYYKAVKEAFPSDVANQLELDLELVYQAVKELRQEGRIGDTN